MNWTGWAVVFLAAPIVVAGLAAVLGVLVR